MRSGSGGSVEDQHRREAQSMRGGDSWPGGSAEL